MVLSKAVDMVPPYNVGVSITCNYRTCPPLQSNLAESRVVGEGGKVEVLSPELPDGTLVDVIILVEPVEQDTTEYLLSAAANRRHLLQALQDLERPSSYIYVNPADL
jgi:antitoxin YefM